MIVLSHPFGNQNVRQALAAMSNCALLDRFYTTVYWDPTWSINSVLPRALRSELNRRSYPGVEPQRISPSPLREAGRLLSSKLGFKVPANSFSTLAVSDNLDSVTARYVDRHKPKAVYGYVGAALETFRSAKRQGAICIYEMPTGYWHFDTKLLQEEALLRPDYADTMPSRHRTADFLAARDEELNLADELIIPSRHVERTLKQSPTSHNNLHLIPYGTNEASLPIRPRGQPRSSKLRVLFVGGLTQRKGIAYLFEAVKMMAPAIELTIIGSKIGHSASVEAAIAQHRWIPSMPNDQILEEMARHDVLVLPSITEAFGLVIGEALSRGLPVITTTASGGPEIIRNGQDGFLVAIRSAEAVAEKLDLLNRDRELLDNMSVSALHRAREFSWQRYRSLLVDTLQHIIDK